MRLRNMVFAVLLLLGLVLLGWPRTEVPVPDRLGTSRDWTDPENAALFRPVAAAPADAHYDRVIYTELGKAERAQ